MSPLLRPTSRRTALATLAALGGLLATSACASSDSTGTTGGTGALQLSFFAPGAAGASAARLGGGANLTVVAGAGHSVDLTAAEFNLSAVEVHGATGVEVENESECEHSASCDPLVSAPLTVSISPTGATVSVTSAVLPEGTVREIELKLASVRLVGTFDGAAFDVVVPLNAKLRQEFNPPVQVGGTSGASNLTVAVPLLDWLKNPDGSVVDPRALTPGSSLQGQFVARVKASLKAFRDDDHNGGDDDHGNSHG